MKIKCDLCGNMFDTGNKEEKSIIDIKYTPYDHKGKRYLFDKRRYLYLCDECYDKIIKQIENDE